VALVDGLRVERDDNDFSDVIAGVSIDLVSAAPGEELTFTVEADREAITAQVQGFVDAYNGVIDFINTQSSYSEDEGAGGPLFGDSLLSGVRSPIRSALFAVDTDTVANDAAGFSTLSLIGIKTGSDGRLSIDSTVFDAKLAENVTAVADLFVDTDGFDNGGAEPNTPEYYQDITADSGLASTLSRAIDRLFDSQDGPINPNTGERTVLKGLFNARRTALRDNISRFDDQIEAKEFRIKGFEESLVKRFAALEQLIGGLNAQGAALTAGLASISFQNKNN
jgi:flagellar hook-associated protein 2